MRSGKKQIGVGIWIRVCYEVDEKEELQEAEGLSERSEFMFTVIYLVIVSSVGSR